MLVSPFLLSALWIWQQSGRAARCRNDRIGKTYLTDGNVKLFSPLVQNVAVMSLMVQLAPESYAAFLARETPTSRLDLRIMQEFRDAVAQANSTQTTS
jgi:hypothetical protein